MTLTETLLAANKSNRTKIPADILEVMDAATAELVNEDLSSKVIKEGDIFPQFELPNVNSNKVSLNEISKSGKTIICFYRGGWCPYCNIQLSALQGALPEIGSKGATLVAITPETPDNSLTTAEKNALRFEVLSDVDNKLAKDLGLVFKLPENIQTIYSQFGLDLEKHNQNTDFELPMAATFVLNEKKEIIYRFVDEDYTKRAEILDILAKI